jgi:hypothetical protein
MTLTEAKVTPTTPYQRLVQDNHKKVSHALRTRITGCKTRMCRQQHNRKLQPPEKQDCCLASPLKHPGKPMKSLMMDANRLRLYERRSAASARLAGWQAEVSRFWGSAQLAAQFLRN